MYKLINSLNLRGERVLVQYHRFHRRSLVLKLLVYVPVVMVVVIVVMVVSFDGRYVAGKTTVKHTNR